MIEIKIAETKEELEQVKGLNYETFVNEIPQHEDDGSGSLTDKFHDDNTYVIAVSENEIIGMISINDKRPFSLDQKLGSINNFFDDEPYLAEIRLLAVKREHRGSRIMYMMLNKLAELSIAHGYDGGVISGYLKNLPLYEKLGFKPFGPRVGEEPAMFQPMVIKAETFYKRLEKLD